MALTFTEFVWIPQRTDKHHHYGSLIREMGRTHPKAVVNIWKIFFQLALYFISIFLSSNQFITIKKKPMKNINIGDHLISLEAGKERKAEKGAVRSGSRL